MSETPDARTRQLLRVALAEMEAREARDDFERALFWTVRAGHVEDRPEQVTLYGQFTSPAEALAYAAKLEADLNCDDMEGFFCTVHPVLPS